MFKLEDYSPKKLKEVVVVKESSNIYKNGSKIPKITFQKTALKYTNNNSTINKWKEQGYVLYKELSKYLRESKLTTKETNKFYIKLTKLGIRITEKIPVDKIETINKQDFKRFYSDEKIGKLLPYNVYITHNDFRKYLKQRTLNVLVNPYSILDSSIDTLKKDFDLGNEDIDDILKFIFKIRDGKIVFKSKVQEENERFEELVQKGIKQGGYLTYNQINRKLYKLYFKVDNIDSFYTRFEELGIKILDEKFFIDYLVSVAKKRGYVIYDEIQKENKDENYDYKCNLFNKFAKNNIKIVEIRHNKIHDIFEELINNGKEKGYITIKQIPSRFFIGHLYQYLKTTLKILKIGLLNKNPYRVISSIIKYSKKTSKKYGKCIPFELIDKYLNENKIVLSEEEKAEISLKLDTLGIKLIDQVKKNTRFEKLIAIGKKQGYLTYEYINKILLDEDFIDDKFNSFCIRLCEAEIKLIEVEKLLKSISKEDFEKLCSDEKIKNLLPEDLHIPSNDFQKYLQPRTINAISKNFKRFFESFDCSINELKKLKGFGYTTIEDLLCFVFDIRDGKIVLKSNNIQNNKNITDAILEAFLKDNNISLEYITSIKNKIIKDIIKQKLNIEIFKNNIEKVFELKRNNINENLDKNIESSVNNITLNNIFNGLKERERDSFYLRYYENHTLQQISLKYSVTREQIRQYIIKAEEKIFNFNFLFTNKLILSIEEVIRTQQIITKEDLYEQFKDYSNDKRDTISFINCFLKNKEYEQSDNFVLSNDVSIEKIKNFLETCSVEPIEEIYKKLEINFNLTSDTIEKVFKILNKFIFKKEYFINPTIPNKVLYLFYIEQRPIHISELESLYKREFDTKNNMHNLHVHIQRMQEIIFCGRGRYTLKTNVDSKILEDNEYLNKVINLLEDKNYELNVNVIKQETKTLYSISELILLLNSNDNFANLGRGYYGLKKWNYNNRKYIKDIIYEYMCKNMRPVSIGELLIYLEKQGKILNEYSLNGLLIHNEDIFKKHSFKKWELREYPSISLNLDENKLNTIKNDTKEIHNLLSEIFIDEKENSINDKATNIDLQQKNTNNIDDFIKIIIEKNTWTKQELINIMKDKSVMISSVIDEINEWSNEQYGDFLLEEENSIYILNEDVRNLIMNKD